MLARVKHCQNKPVLYSWAGMGATFSKYNIQEENRAALYMCTHVYNYTILYMYGMYAHTIVCLYNAYNNRFHHFHQHSH